MGEICPRAEALKLAPVKGHFTVSSAFPRISRFSASILNII
jgi:hypothetical protein